MREWTRDKSPNRAKTRKIFCFWGRRPGCNPPSVLSSICLIGEPAPPAEDHRRLLPLSHRHRDPFHPQSNPSINAPREEDTSSSYRTGKVSFLRPRTGSHPAPLTITTVSAMWVEFPQDHDHGPVTAHRLAATPKHLIMTCCAEGPLNMISLRTWTPHGPNTLCDWGSRAERLDRSLDAYTPIPSTPSSMGALVTVPQSCRQDWYIGLEWLPIFGRGFGLRCFQPLSSIAWLPGSALSDNR